MRGSVGLSKAFRGPGEQRRASAAARAACDSSALTLSPARGVAVLDAALPFERRISYVRFSRTLAEFFRSFATATGGFAGRQFLRDSSSDTSLNSYS